MNQLLLYFIIGLGSVLAIDSLGAIASKKLSFNYKILSILSFAVYAAVGYLVGQVASVIHAAVVCMVLGLFDVTIGWKISWFIGPGRLSPEYNKKFYIIRAIIMVPIFAGAIGYITAMVTI